MFYRSIKNITIKRDIANGFPFIWIVCYGDGDTSAHCCLSEDRGYEDMQSEIRFYKSISGTDISIVDRRDEGDCNYMFCSDDL